MGKKKINQVANVIDTVLAVCTTEKVQKLLCGTYSDGEVRSVPDALNGEVYSPKQKAKKDKKRKKGKHKKIC